jgi:hypothetical protein
MRELNSLINAVFEMNKFITIIKANLYKLFLNFVLINAISLNYLLFIKILTLLEKIIRYEKIIRSLKIIHPNTLNLSSFKINNIYLILKYFKVDQYGRNILN